MFFWVKCKACLTKDSEIAYLRKQADDLLNRLMSKDFSQYVITKQKPKEEEKDKTKPMIDSELGEM